jgi:hypothetical protein
MLEVELQAAIVGDTLVGVDGRAAAEVWIQAEPVGVAEITERLLVQVEARHQMIRASTHVSDGEC